MAITILTGLPGSGKSETLISQVNAVRREGRKAMTFMCSDSPTLRARTRITELGRMGCRAGISVALDYFVSSERAMELLDEAPADALLAFDEAQHFSDALVDAWCAAAGRGDVLIASPSPAQVEALTGRGHRVTRLRVLCHACRIQEASHFFCFLAEDRTESVCELCYSRRRADAEREIVDRLRNTDPSPGEQRLHQPVELHQCSTWEIVREDSIARLELMLDLCREQRLPEANSSYLDIGCGTGFFCNRMSLVGFRSSGVDARPADIATARLLSTYVRDDYVTYTASNIPTYLDTGQDRSFDLVSAFDSSHWIPCDVDPQTERGCLLKLFCISGRICILESATSAGPGIVNATHTGLDTAGLHDFMETKGGFEQVDRIEGSLQGLQHDLLIGYKSRRGTSTSCRRPDKNQQSATAPVAMPFHRPVQRTWSK